VGVTTKAIFGKPDAISVRLAALHTSTTINTSDVEREHLTLRQHNRRLTRKTNGFGKELTWLEQQL
jgi:IS1 family transposase